MQKIVHLGLGNFHRAHQAWYTHHANRQGGDQWGIIGVSMSRQTLKEALDAQDRAYTLAIQGIENTSFETIDVLDQVIVAADEPGAVIHAIAQPATQIVTLTITEKGYASLPDGQLNLQDPGIAADLTAQPPKSAIGLLARGLAQRAELGHPLTVISCDNLPDNGSRLASAVAAFSDAAGLPIADYLAAHVAFPNTMVDRITPATTPELMSRVETETGRADQAPVATETFSEWVIEDRFAAARPTWQAAGAQIVTDVRPYELRKLRVLNAAHSLLAYAGILRGHTFVHDAINDPELRAHVNGLWDEAQDTLPEQSRAGIQSYRQALLDRFDVTEMRHALSQIAMDGSLKVASRIIPIIKERNMSGLPSPFSVEAVAHWITFALFDRSAADPFLATLPPMSTEGANVPEMRKHITDALGWSSALDQYETALDQSIQNTLTQPT